MTVLEEYKDLIKAGVKANATQLRQSGDVADVSQADASEDYLKRWLKEEYPFSWVGTAFEHLLQAVVTDRLSVHLGLPGHTKDAMRVHQWATLIVDMTLPDATNVTITAPLTKSGPSMNVCRAALEKILDLAAGFSNEMAPRSFAIAAFVRAADRLKINFVPWKLPANGNAGRPPRNPVYNYWLGLGERLADEDAPPRPQDPVRMARERGIGEDVQADWEASQTTIAQLSRLLNQTTPLDEWKFTNTNFTSNPDVLVKSTYDYVWESFDMRKPLHHLALLTAIILEKMAPRIDYPNGVKPLKGSMPAQITTFIRITPWVKRPAKGRTEVAPIIVLTTIYIIAMYDKESPIRKHIDRGNGIGEAWSKKHNAKALTPAQLICLGLARGLMPRALGSARYRRDFELLSDDEILKRYKKLINLFKDGAYGPFHAAALVLGYREAWYLGKTGGQYVVDQAYEPIEKRGNEGSDTEDTNKRTAKGKKTRTG